MLHIGHRVYTSSHHHRLKFPSTFPFATFPFAVCLELIASVLTTTYQHSTLH